MKTKIAIISSGILLSAGVGLHVAHYCPLQHLKANTAHTTQAPAQASNEAKPGTVTLR